MRRGDTRNHSNEREGQRVFRVGQAWFYHTREGRRGPFERETDLRADLQSYVGTMEFIEVNAALLPGELDCSDVTFLDIEAPRWANGTIE